MRKIILIFLVGVSVLFGQTEKITVSVNYIDVHKAWDWYKRIYYYPVYDSSNQAVKWFRIGPHQELYEFIYEKGGDKQIRAYAIYDKELQLNWVIRYQFYTIKNYFDLKYIVDAVMTDKASHYFGISPVELRGATIDERFGDINFDGLDATFNINNIYCIFIENLDRANKICNDNLGKTPKANKTGIIKYKDGNYNFIFATEDCNGNAFTAEDIAKINEAETVMTTSQYSLIFEIGIDWFDGLWEFAQQYIR